MIKYKKIEHDIYPLLSQLKESLSIDNNIIFAYIFGSYGVGKPTPLSDVDIAVYLSSKENIWGKKMELIEKITSILKTDELDIVVLNGAPLSLQFQVLKTGRLLFSKNDKLRINFITRVYDIYCDVEPLRKIAHENLIRRIHEGKIGIK
jgi:predicted nucleotidyltransferase